MPGSECCPQSTLVVLLGASAWPHYPGLSDLPAARYWATRLRTYFLDTAGFALPSENLLDLFDDEANAIDLLQQIEDFLQERLANSAAMRDLIVYYAGHGNFAKGDVRREATYYLALRSTKGYPVEAATGLVVGQLAGALRAWARQLRRYLILDACFAAAAAEDWQAAESDIVQRQAHASSLETGTALLCAAGPDQGAKDVAFSGGLLAALTNGTRSAERRLSLRELGDLIWDQIRGQEDATRPQVHSPGQAEGDIAAVRLFPNSGWSAEWSAEGPKLLADSLELIRIGQLESAISKLRQIELAGPLIAEGVFTQSMYERACAESLRAEALNEGPQKSDILDTALDYVGRWIVMGLSGVWTRAGNTAQNQIYRMGCDADLREVLKKRTEVLKRIPPELGSSLPLELPWRQQSTGGGCVREGTLIAVPGGLIAVESLREGSEILSFDLASRQLRVAKVTKMHAMRAITCVRLNGSYDFTRTHPLYSERGMVTPAGGAVVGDELLDAKGGAWRVRGIEHPTGYMAVYTLTTDGPAHNFIAGDLVCGNKR